MRLHKSSFTNRLGKAIARPLSQIACSRLFYNPVRMADAYLNFLIGKGAGTGWDMRHEVDAAVEHIHRDQPVVFDIGANVGNWTQGLLQAIPQAMVYMFDPSPGCQAIIRQKNFFFGGGVKLMPFALGEQPGQLPYYSSSATDGSASLHMRRDTPFENFKYQQSTVEVRTLDDIIAGEKIEFVDFMKMDIEGHELFALRGARRSLKAGKIGAFSFEFGCGNVNSKTFFLDFWEFLRPLNYQIYRISPSGKSLPVLDYYEDAEYFRGATNYIVELAKVP